jgi:tetratricopeptide (TPR) repeat protein
MTNARRGDLASAAAGLGPLLQEAFAALGAFASSPADFERAAALAVCEDGASVGDEGLRALVDLGLLDRGAPGRFLLPTEALNAAEERLGDRRAPRAKHAQFYRLLASRPADGWRGVEREWAQIDRAWRWACGPTGSPEEVIRLATATRLFFEHRGRWAESVAWTERALLAARALPSAKEESIQLNNLGLAWANSNDHARAVAYYESALRILETIRDSVGTAATLLNLGGSYADLGDLQRAEECYRRALPIQQAIGDKRKSATLDSLGSIHVARGETALAIQCYEDAISSMEASDDRTHLASVLNNLGTLFSRIGDYERAAGYLEKALEQARATDDLMGEATVLNNLADTRAGAGKLPEALDLMRATLAIYEKTRHPDAAAYRQRLMGIRSNVKSGLIGCAAIVFAVVLLVVAAVVYVVHLWRASH